MIRLMLMIRIVLISIVASLLPQSAKAESFDEWLASFRQEALQAGVSADIVGKALTEIQPLHRAIELDRKQPEGTMTFTKYRERIVHPFRIDQGRKKLARHRDLLEEIGARYGVAPKYIVALWGIESNYGSNTGGFDIIPALATLAWEGRRREFFSKELLNALKILDEGHIAFSDMKGSWAGAMGQSQFMPSSFRHYAADGDGDGRKDIWTNEADVFASAANYLARHGWQDGERWGREVRIPATLSESLISLEIEKPLSEWRALGVTLPNGAPVPVAEGIKASLVAPDGQGGDAFLAYSNFKTIMKWNRSTYFASSVGLLADAIDP